MKTKPGAPKSWAALIGLGLLLAPTPALAAEGSLPTVVLDIGVSLLSAGLLAIIFSRLRIPSIAAFLLAGVVVGPLVLDVVSDPDSIETIAQIGFVLLLFTIGLEIDVRHILSSGKKLLLVGALQFPLTLLFGLAVSYLLVALGTGGQAMAPPLAPFYVGVTIATSSSLLVIALFQQHFELDTQPGRTALVILIFQDLWAIVVMLIQPNMSNPSLSAIFFAFAGIAIVILLAAAGSRFIMPVAFRWIAKSRELTVLAALTWCFIIVAIGMHVDNLTALVGVDLGMDVGPGMAALIAGAVIASLPFSTEIVTKVGLVKDFFVTLFFVGLGISIPAITGWGVPLLGLFVALLAVIARQVVFFPLLYWLGVDQRTSEVTSIRLAQISEFALVIAFIGVQSGHIGADLASAIILAFVFTSVLTTPLYKYAYGIHAALKTVLDRIGFKETAVAHPEDAPEGNIVVLGLYNEAAALLRNLAVHQPELMPRVTIVDFNVAAHDEFRRLGARVTYGDLANETTLLHAGVDRAAVLMSTVPDHLLRGTSNAKLVRGLRAANPSAVIIANAVDEAAGEAIHGAGADYVYVPAREIALGLSDALKAALDGRITEFRTQRLAAED